MNDLGIILLAAGLGKRMKSDLPKVLHLLGGKPLFFYPLRAARSLEPAKIAIVIGHRADEVKRACDEASVTWVFQERQLGTGDAVRCTEEFFHDFPGDLLILSGDVPLISRKTLSALLLRHREKGATLTFLTARLDQPSDYGRVLRNRNNQIEGIVEERDATEQQKGIQEINAGIYAVAPRFLYQALARLTNRNQQQEYYLPDIVKIALTNGDTVEAVPVNDTGEISGINTRQELAMMEHLLQENINRKWMESGVTIKDPRTTYIEGDVQIGKDTIIGPNTHLMGRTVIGERCRIDGNAYVTDARIGSGVHLRFSVVLTDCRIDDDAFIGPFAHLRPGTSLGRAVHIGNFVETKEATLGDGTKANHLTYLGDVTIGRETNVGAGTITCNYDGFKKYRTSIGDRVQVGSDSTLVAPISLGNDVYVATATTVRHDVPAGALVYNERREAVREGWTEHKRNKMKAKI